MGLSSFEPAAVGPKFPPCTVLTFTHRTVSRRSVCRVSPHAHAHAMHMHMHTCMYMSMYCTRSWTARANQSQAGHARTVLYSLAHTSTKGQGILTTHTRTTRRSHTLTYHALSSAQPVRYDSASFRHHHWQIRRRHQRHGQLTFHAAGRLVGRLPSQ